MVKLTTLDAVRMNRADPDAIIAAGELVDLRFVSGNTLSLRAAKLFCLLIHEAGIAVADAPRSTFTPRSVPKVARHIITSHTFGIRCWSWSARHHDVSPTVDSAEVTVSCANSISA